MQSAPLKPQAQKPATPPEAPTQQTQPLQREGLAGEGPIPESVIRGPDPVTPLVAAPDPTIRVDPEAMYVLDLSAVSEDRYHVMKVGSVEREFTFRPRRPTPLQPAVAVRFLKNEGFILTDAAGNPLDWAPTPRQPHDLGAGENLSLGENEVIATYEELGMGSLRKRALQLGASEKAMDAEKGELIEFIKGKTLELRRQGRNQRKDATGEELDLEEFVPDAAMLADSGPAYTL